MRALLWPGLVAVASCLAVMYLPIARRHPWPTFYAQMVVGLVTLSMCIHLAATGDMAVAARLLFVLILVPPHMVSQRAGMVATLACLAAHMTLIGAGNGFTWAAFTAGASLGPMVAFVL